MYIHWTHHYLPKIFAFLSFICNPVFIYLIVTEKKNAIGRYRFLFLFFAIFDMVYSAVEFMVPMAIHGTGAAFIVFIPDGPFFENDYKEVALTLRTSFVALSYGILVVHFIYRYLILYKPNIIDTILNPIGMLFIFLFFLLHAVVWYTICKLCLVGELEIRDYIYEDFMETYGVDSHKIAMLTAMYFDAPSWIVRRSWLGIFLLTCLSTYAISTYFILGYKIMQKLKENKGISARTSKLHKQLFKALVVQTGIPICISFAPCLCAWWTPAIGLNLGMWNNFIGAVALSTFPTLDPLAIIILLPNYRNRIVNYCRNVSRISTFSITIPTEDLTSSNLKM